MPEVPEVFMKKGFGGSGQTKFRDMLMLSRIPDILYEEYIQDENEVLFKHAAEYIWELEEFIIKNTDILKEQEDG